MVITSLRRSCPDGAAGWAVIDRVLDIRIPPQFAADVPGRFRTAVTV